MKREKESNQKQRWKRKEGRKEGKDEMTRERNEIMKE